MLVTYSGYPVSRSGTYTITSTTYPLLDETTTSHDYRGFYESRRYVPIQQHKENTYLKAFLKFLTSSGLLYFPLPYKDRSPPLPVHHTQSLSSRPSTGMSALHGGIRVFSSILDRHRRKRRIFVQSLYSAMCA